jgi:hypothetical protein
VGLQTPLTTPPPLKPQKRHKSRRTILYEKWEEKKTVTFTILTVLICGFLGCDTMGRPVGGFEHF